MNSRERFINYVKQGDKEPFVSLQIGGGAGFDCKLAGKEWSSEGTLSDTIHAYEIVECDAFFNIGLPAFDGIVPELTWKNEVKVEGKKRITNRWLKTPYGELHFQFHEQKRLGVTPIQYPITIDDGLDKVLWYAEQHLKAIPYIQEILSPNIKEARLCGPVSIQWNIQPFELFGLATVVDLVMYAMINPQTFRRACDLVRQVNIELIKEVFRCGADFIFLGGPGVELASPKIYEEYLIPDSQAITRAVHNLGGLVYSHICSPIEPFLSKGYYNQMGIDLFETLSPPPVGNVENLAQARSVLDPQICTRGNIGLDVLLNGGIEDIKKVTIAILEATSGSKHIVGASDYLPYDIPLENVKTVIRTVKEYGKYSISI